MKVGVLGSGVVGQTLGRGFASRGHRVMIGSRMPNSEQLTAWKRKAGSNAATGTFAQTAAFGEVLALATLGEAVEKVLELAGKKNFDGKVLIDATNPLSFKGGSVTLFMGTTDSLGELIQRKLPKARVVKCFNTVGNSQMVDPKHKDTEMLICGDNAGAKEKVADIVKEFGWKGAIDVGGIEAARWLEALVPLWVRAGARFSSRDHVFKVLHD